MEGPANFEFFLLNEKKDPVVSPSFSLCLTSEAINQKLSRQKKHIL